MTAVSESLGRLISSGTRRLQTGSTAPIRTPTSTPRPLLRDVLEMTSRDPSERPWASEEGALACLDVPWWKSCPRNTRSLSTSKSSPTHPAFSCEADTGKVSPRVRNLDEPREPLWEHQRPLSTPDRATAWPAFPQAQKRASFDWLCFFLSLLSDTCTLTLIHFFL